MGKGNKNNETTRSILRLLLYVAEVLISVALAIIVADIDELTREKAVTILIANMVLLTLTSRLMNEIFIRHNQDETTEKHLEMKKEMKDLHEKIVHIGSVVEYERTFKNLLEVEHTEQRETYKNAFKFFLKTMSSRWEGARSGALSKFEYYDKLEAAAQEIKTDRENFKYPEKDRKSYMLKYPDRDYPGDKYVGQIWAVTFWQDDELDKNDTEWEGPWVETMQEMDIIYGIKTIRLHVMKDKLDLLKKKNMDEDDKSKVEEFLNKLNYYTKENNSLEKTTSYAMEKLPRCLDQDARNLLHKGFFAIKLNNGNLKLIRDVSLDNHEDTTLGGEIVFDNNKIIEIKKVWDRLISQNRKKTIEQFVYKVASPDVKTMAEAIFKTDPNKK